MKSTNYNILMEKADVNNEVELSLLINRRLDEILASAYNKKETMQALLCMFESKSNRSAFYSIMSISYAILLGIISLASTLVSGENERDWIAVVIMTAIMALVAIIIMKAGNMANQEEERIKFISYVIKSRSENLSDNETDYAIHDNDNEKVYYVTVKPGLAATKEINTEN